MERRDETVNTAKAKRDENKRNDAALALVSLLGS